MRIAPLHVPCGVTDRSCGKIVHKADVASSATKSALKAASPVSISVLTAAVCIEILAQSAAGEAELLVATSAQEFRATPVTIEDEG